MGPGLGGGIEDLLGIVLHGVRMAVLVSGTFVCLFLPEMLGPGRKGKSRLYDDQGDNARDEDRRMMAQLGSVSNKHKTDRVYFNIMASYRCYTSILVFSLIGCGVLARH